MGRCECKKTEKQGKMATCKRGHDPCRKSVLCQSKRLQSKPENCCESCCCKAERLQASSAESTKSHKAKRWKTKVKNVHGRPQEVCPDVSGRVRGVEGSWIESSRNTEKKDWERQNGELQE